MLQSIIPLLKTFPWTQMVIAALGLALWLTMGNMEEMEQRHKDQMQVMTTSISELQTANSTNVKSIETLNELREMDYSIIKGLNVSLSDVLKRHKAATDKLAKLEKDYETVRTYQSHVVPVQLGCVLEPTLCPDAADGGNPRPVPTP